MEDLVATLEGLTGEENPAQYFTMPRYDNRAIFEVDVKPQRRPLRRQNQSSFSSNEMGEVEFSTLSQKKRLRRQNQDSFSNTAGLNEVEFALARKKKRLRRQNQDSFSNEAMGSIRALDFKGLGNNPTNYFAPVGMDFQRELIQINAEELETNAEGRRPLQRQRQAGVSFEYEVSGLGWNPQYWTPGYKQRGLIIRSGNQAFNRAADKVNRVATVDDIRKLSNSAVAIRSGIKVLTPAAKKPLLGIIGFIALAALAL